MLKFSDLSVGDYVWWSEQRPNMGGDYDLVFRAKKLNLGDFVFMEENAWNEYDLDEFVKPIEITHRLMEAVGFQKAETWSGIVQYTSLKEVKDGVEYDGLKFNLKECIEVEMLRDEDIVRNIKAHSFNGKGAFTVERIKPKDEPHYLHELQHAARECGVELNIELPDEYCEFNTLVDVIIGKVMELHPACEKYREMIMDELLCYMEKDLPFYDEDIKHFVDTELRERLSKSAAAKIVSGYDEDFQGKYFQVVADYLDGNRGLSVMLAVMNGEEDAIEDVKREINKQEDKKVFQKDYVWLWKSTLMSGKHFIHRDETRIFKNHDAACMEMQQKQAEVIRMFRQHYGSVKPFEDVNLFQVCDEDTYDVWEGKITKMYIED